jgi:probable O-glycosylation ligase (exosortase A-associated)
MPGWIAALALVSVGAGALALHAESPLVAAALLGAAPVAVAILAMTHWPLLGAVLYLACEYLQPGHRIPPLAAAHPTLALTAGLVVAYVLNVLARRRRATARNWQVKAFLLFLVLLAASAAEAVSVPMVARAGLDMVKMFAVFFIFIQITDTTARLERLVWAYVIIHFVLGLIGIALFATPGERRFGDVGGGFLGDENDSAMALLIMLPYVYFFLHVVRRTWTRLFLVAALLAGSSAVLFSFSRGAFLGFAVTLFYLWLRSSRKVLAAAGLGVLAALFLAVMPAAYWQRIESIGGYRTEGSAQGRIEAWSGALAMVADHPLVGVGVDNFNRTFGERYNTTSTRWTAPHSLYFQTLGELGLLGAAFLVWFVAWNFRDLRRLRAALGPCAPGSPAHRLRVITLAIECGLVSYLVTTIFLTSLLYPHLWHFATMTAIAVNCGARLAADAAANATPGRNLSLARRRDRLPSAPPSGRAAQGAAGPAG